MVVLPWLEAHSRSEGLWEDPGPRDWSDLPHVPGKRGTSLTSGAWRKGKPLSAGWGAGVGVGGGKVEGQGGQGEKRWDSGPQSADGELPGF